MSKMGELKQHEENLKVKQSVVNEIMQYKELVDEEIITEEEFSIKEEELLRNNKISMQDKELRNK